MCRQFLPGSSGEILQKLPMPPACGTLLRAIHCLASSSTQRSMEPWPRGPATRACWLDFVCFSSPFQVLNHPRDHRDLQDARVYFAEQICFLTKAAEAVFLELFKGKKRVRKKKADWITRNVHVRSSWLSTASVRRRGLVFLPPSGQRSSPCWASKSNSTFCG